MAARAARRSERIPLGSQLARAGRDRRAARAAPRPARRDPRKHQSRRDRGFTSARLDRDAAGDRSRAGRARGCALAAGQPEARPGDCAERHGRAAAAPAHRHRRHAIGQALQRAACRRVRSARVPGGLRPGANRVGGLGVDRAARRQRAALRHRDLERRQAGRARARRMDLGPVEIEWLARSGRRGSRPLSRHAGAGTRSAR